jgi:hypothetical protein
MIVLFILVAIIKIVFVLFFIAALFLVLILFIPINYKFKGILQENLDLKIILHWIFRLLEIKITYMEEIITINLLIINRPIFTKSLNEIINKKIKTYKKSKKNKKIKLNNISWNKLNKFFLNHVIFYLKNIIKIIKPSHIKLNGVYGFEDPSITGSICALTSILSGIIPNSNIELNPIFDKNIMDIELKIWGKLNLALLVILTLRFILNKEIRKILFTKTETT